MSADRLTFLCNFSDEKSRTADHRRVRMSVSPDEQGDLVLEAYDGLVAMAAPIDDWKKAIAWAESEQAARVWRPRVESAIVGKHRVVIELQGMGANDPSRVVGVIDKATPEAIVVFCEDGEISVLGWPYIDDISTATRMGVVALPGAADAQARLRRAADETADLVVSDALRAVARGLDDLAEAA